jgi:hypothetical protein
VNPVLPSHLRNRKRHSASECDVAEYSLSIAYKLGQVIEPVIYQRCQSVDPDTEIS